MSGIIVEEILNLDEHEAKCRPDYFLKKNRIDRTPTHSLQDFSEIIKIKYPTVAYRARKIKSLPHHVHLAVGRKQYRLNDLIDWHNEVEILINKGIRKNER